MEIAEIVETVEIVEIVWMICLRWRPTTRVEIVKIVEMIWKSYLKRQRRKEWLKMEKHTMRAMYRQKNILDDFPGVKRRNERVKNSKNIQGGEVSAKKST